MAHDELNIPIDDIPALVVVLDASGRITHANAAACARLDYPGGEHSLVDRDFLSLVVDEDRARIAATLRIMHARLADDAPRRPRDRSAAAEGFDLEELRVRTRAGDIVDLELSARPLAGSTRGRVICAANDRTARKSSEKTLIREREKYRTIFRKSPTMTLLVDFQGTVLEWNDLLGEKYAGHGSPAPEKLHFTDFITPKEVWKLRRVFSGLYLDAEKIRARWDWSRIRMDVEYRDGCYQELMELGIQYGMTTFHNRARDVTYDAEYNVNLIADKTTLDIIGFLVTAVDITTRNLFRKKLEESEEKYRELFMHQPILSMLIDTAGKTVEFNYKAMDEYGPLDDYTSLSYTDYVHPEDHAAAASLFIDLYARASRIRQQWARDRELSKEDCFRQMRTLRIVTAPLRLMNARKDQFIETEISASLWIGEEDLIIHGALVTAYDVSDRNRFRRQLEESERKYRELVEEKTHDIIFSLDLAGRFLTANINMAKKLGYHEDDLAGRHVRTILYDDPFDVNRINRETFAESVERIIAGGASDVHLKAVCCHKHLGEPVPLRFRMNPVLADGRVTGVLGVASEISDDPLRDYLRREELSYRIDSKISFADETSYRITRNLPRYFDEERIGMIRLGLREIIINAIEHGNLEITFDEKSRATEQERYFDLLRDRQSDPDRRSKKVSIDYRLDEERAEYVIRDEGAGFDVRSVLERDPSAASEQGRMHGRGILIVRTVFDEVAYNERGNEVRLVAYVNRDAR
ncbi:MAG TPA: PAS domain S-box protein [Spirochaetota bacterium]|nr:PAS domain S-box protein [Spirochaetota bacterium]HNT12728.1 PAS domain S-box protein [Spirochaetota bacterium]HOS38139.1 PAS domain S-box protein [Spirochaetota bacterium]HPU88473.1 PAS domain S-box protein [Spirochaetota bacterium]